MKNLLLGLFILTGIGIIAFFILPFFMMLIFILSLENSSKKELIENYEKNKKSIEELKNYFDKIVPENYQVYIEFKNDEKIDFQVYEYAKNEESEMIYWFNQSTIYPYNYKPDLNNEKTASKYDPKTKSLDLIKSKLGWNNDSFRELSKKLSKANCISIRNGEPTEIGFARSGMGKYFYHLFKNNIPKNELKEWNDSCSYIYYNPKLVLGYGGGAFGSQCFPDP